jgi:hypothetical protein
VLVKLNEGCGKNPVDYLLDSTGFTVEYVDIGLDTENFGHPVPGVGLRPLGLGFDNLLNLGVPSKDIPR